MILNSPYITGSLTVTGNATIQGALIVTGSLSGTASLALNSDLLQGTGSTGFTTTASFNAVSSSQQQISASLLILTASYTALSSSYIALSGSYNTFSGSASTRVTQIENTYATTGSNSFRADQSITGSLVVSSTITAQTLVVQTVTSSIVYSSGSNLFGNSLSNTQTFTGSVNITGSITQTGVNTTSSFSGNVGIGITTPSAVLHTSGVTKLGGGNLHVSSDQTFVTSNSYTFRDAMGINNPNSVSYPVSSNYTVAIGSSGGGGSLLTAGPIYSSGSITVSVINYPQLVLNSSNNNGPQLRFQGGGSNTSGIGHISSVSNLEFSSTSSLAVQMTLSQAGNLGIGTASPGNKLQVNSIAGNYGITNTNGTVTIGTYIEASNTYASFGTSTNHPLGFFTNNNAPQLYLHVNGNFGVGTSTDAGYKLDVNGTGRFSGTSSLLYLNNTTATTGKVWRFSSASNGNFYITQESVVDALTLSVTTGAATFSSTIAATSATFSGDITLSGTNQQLNGGTTTGRISVSNSSSTSYITLTGNTYASTPNIIYFVNSSALTLTLNANNTATFAGALTGTSATFSSSVTANGNIIYINGGQPETRYTENDVGALPLGLWRTVLGGDAFYVQKNTAVAGDFSTATNCLMFANTAAATFSSSVTANQIFSTTTAAGYAAILTNTNGASDSNGLLVKASSMGTEYVVRFANQTDTSTFFTIKGTGNVLIGTTTDDTVNKLQVTGDIKVSAKLKVGSTQVSTNSTTSAITTAKTIYSRVGNGKSEFVFVMGDVGGTAYFADIVSFASGASVVVISSTTTYGSPSARTYSVSGNNLQLSMASGTAETQVFPISGS